MPYMRVDELTHGSYFRASSGYPELWRVQRHVEGYSFVEYLGGQEFPRVEMIPASTMIWVDPEAKTHRLASEVGAYSIGPEEDPNA